MSESRFSITKGGSPSKRADRAHLIDNGGGVGGGGHHEFTNPSAEPAASYGAVKPESYGNLSFPLIKTRFKAHEDAVNMPTGGRGQKSQRGGV